MPSWTVLPEAHVVGQDEACLTEDLEVADDAGDERPLVRCETDALTRRRRLDEGRLLVGRRVPLGDLDDAALEDALDVLDDDIEASGRASRCVQSASNSAWTQATEAGSSSSHSSS